MPSSKPPSLRPVSKNDSSVAISSAVAGRRYARRASVVRICLAQSFSLTAVAAFGRQMNTLRRLADSAARSALNGPWMRT